MFSPAGELLEPVAALSEPYGRGQEIHASVTLMVIKIEFKIKARQIKGKCESKAGIVNQLVEPYRQAAEPYRQAAEPYRQAAERGKFIDISS